MSASLRGRLRRLRSRLLPRRAQGAVLPTAAAFMVVLLLFGGLGWFYAQRAGQIQRAESALREATRTAAQLWSYGSFGGDGPLLRDEGAVRERATTILAQNLGSVPGLVGDPTTIAATANWEVLPGGGACGDQTFAQAALCGRLEVPVQAIPLGIGGEVALVQIAAASTLEVVRSAP